MCAQPPGLPKLVSSIVLLPSTRAEEMSIEWLSPSRSPVMDVSAAPFNGQNAPLFENSTSPRVDRFIDERNTNNCFHLELAVTP